MILFNLVTGEDDPRYQALEVANGERHYDFLKSVVTTALSVGQPFLSSTVIKALNFHAIACLHVAAGEFRPCPVHVGTDAEKFEPPPHYLVPSLVDDMVNVVNRSWDRVDAIVLSSFVLWRMNYIHPFINGNGRTARASCYLVLCLKEEKLLPGKTILPELIKRERPKYVEALKKVDQSAIAGKLDLTPLADLVSVLVKEQLASANSAQEAGAPPAAEAAAKPVAEPAQAAPEAAAKAKPAAKKPKPPGGAQAA
jgi:Fic family protein